MSTPALVTLVAGALGAGYTPATWQEMIAHAFDVSHGELNISGVNFTSTEPAAADRDKPWMRLVAGEIERTYAYFTAAGVPGWYVKNPVPASSSERRMWVGALADLLTYDGGVNEAVTDIAGPMWAEDTNFAGRVPLHPGVLDNGGAFQTTVAVGDQGGVGELVIPSASAPALATAGDFQRAGAATGGTGAYAGTNSAALNVMPKYRGIYIIKRTARIYYKPV